MLTKIEGVLCDDSRDVVGCCAQVGRKVRSAPSNPAVYVGNASGIQKQNRADMFVNLRSIEVGGDAMAFSTGTLQANAFG
jgi:hypothetical protein